MWVYYLRRLLYLCYQILIMSLEFVSLKEMPLEVKKVLLEKLGYTTDGVFVFDSKGEVVKDKYLNIPVNIENMVIFPGSNIILDNNELSISAYLEEYGEI